VSTQSKMSQNCKWHPILLRQLQKGQQLFG